MPQKMAMINFQETIMIMRYKLLRNICVRHAEQHNHIQGCETNNRELGILHHNCNFESSRN